MSARADSYADRFLAAWQVPYVPEAVATGDPAALALPQDWRESLGRFFVAGLNAEGMLDAITITMDREDVADASLFRYFCGVGWRMLREEHGEPRRQQSGSSAGHELPKLPRSTVRTVACPHCGAPVGEHCVGARGKPRESNHSERVLAADAMASR